MPNFKLTAVPGKQEVTITCTFNAPREKVFKAYTDPGLIPRWWGPEKYHTTVDKLDARPGGQWRFLQSIAGGKQEGFHGVYHEIKAPELIVDTFEYEGMPEAGHVTLEKVTFEETGGVTTVSTVIVFVSQADRDGMVSMGMEGGLREGMDRLAKVLETE